jgi:hypothetical protein
VKAYLDLGECELVVEETVGAGGGCWHRMRNDFRQLKLRFGDQLNVFLLVFSEGPTQRSDRVSEAMIGRGMR